MIVVNVLMSLIILIVIPMFMGLLVTAPLDVKERSLGLLMPAGYICMLLSFELVTLPILLTTHYQNFYYVLWIYTPIMLILAGLGVWVTYRNAGSISGIAYEIRSLVSAYDRSKGMMWIAVAVVLVFILFLSERYVIFDSDDAYYVVQSLITQVEKSMYVTQPYTGGAASLDTRHAMAVFTMWISYVGTLTGIHTTVLCHTVLPLVFIPLALITYTEIGLRLLHGKQEMLPYFALIVEVIMLFGRPSLFTPEAFLLARTWQGKSMAANLLIPMIVLSLMILFRDKKKGGYLLVILTGAAAGIFSSLAVILGCMLIALGGVWYGIYTHKIVNTIRVWLCLIPGALYILLYLYFTYVAWTP